MGTQQFLFFSFTHVGDLKLLVLWIDMDAATVESEIFFANGLVEGCGQLIESPFNRKHLTRYFFLVGTLRQFGFLDAALNEAAVILLQLIQLGQGVTGNQFGDRKSVV